MYSVVEMVAQGYRVGAPSQEVEDIDAAIAERYSCPKCGGSMRYQGYHRYDGSYCSYIALAVCNRCGHTISF